jgi:Resolvase, N terminal domain
MPSEVNAQTVRAGAYARYSSDHQSDASIDDQVRICRAEIERQGWGLVEVYTDAALSGASTFRPRYQKLLKDATTGALDIVVAESLDRLSRDLADVATLYKHLSYLGVRLWDRGRGACYGAAGWAQGHDERAVPEGPRPEDAPRPGGAGAQRHVRRRHLLWL